MIDRAAWWSSAIALSVTVLGIVYVAGRPLDSADLWWHLAMGAHYSSEGPWLTGDPLLHTALPEAPIQHEWLFGVAVHALERAVGFFGMRLLHALAVLAILALAFVLLRREGRHVPLAMAGTVIFAALSVWRLAQFRPDLVSIPAAMAVAGLLVLHGRVPSWRMVALVCVATALWANFHSLFAIGPALLLAALVGLGLRAAMCRVFSVEAGTRAEALSLRWAAALAGSVLLSALNPRGFAQHLTFFTSSRDRAVWMVRDEWTHFHPFAFLPEYGMAVSRFTWLLSDAVVLAFLGVALASFVRFVRNPTSENLEGADPVRFGLGLAGVVALVVSIRFQWMLIFALLFIANAIRVAVPERSRSRLGIGAGVAAVACAALASTGPLAPSLDQFRPGRLKRYVSTPYEVSGYHVPGVRFLRETAMEGRLFNAYLMGGFLGYWTSSSLRTFIDGRTEHYPREVVNDYLAVNEAVVRRAGESFEEILERRGVDVFFGVGLPLERSPGHFDPYTTMHLAGNPDWVLVERGLDHAIYLRKNERNRANLARVVRYYARLGVPFDTASGLDVPRILKEQPDWARAQGLLPVTEAKLQQARTSGRPRVRFAALQRLALFRFLVGDFEEQIALDRSSVSLQPQSKAAWRRLAAGLAFLGRREEALEAAGRLIEIEPRDERSRSFAAAVRSGDRERLLRLAHLTRAEAAAEVSGRISPPGQL